MSLQLAGGTTIDNTVDPASASALIDHLETHLVSAGWSIISGSGTDNIKFQSAATPEGSQARIEVDVVSGEVDFILLNADETVSSSTGYVRINPEGPFRLIAHKFAFVLYANGSEHAFNDAGGGKRWVWAGTAHIPSHLPQTRVDIGFLFGDHRSSLLDNLYECFKFKPWVEGTPAGYALFRDGNLYETTNVSASNVLYGDPGLLYPDIGISDSAGLDERDLASVWRWSNGARFSGDAILCMANGRNSSPQRPVAQFYGVLLLCDEDLRHEQTITIGSNTFRCFTNQFAATGANRKSYALVWFTGSS